MLAPLSNKNKLVKVIILADAFTIFLLNSLNLSCAYEIYDDEVGRVIPPGQTHSWVSASSSMPSSEIANVNKKTPTVSSNKPPELPPSDPGTPAEPRNKESSPDLSFFYKGLNSSMDHIFFEPDKSNITSRALAAGNIITFGALGNYIVTNVEQNDAGSPMYALDRVESAARLGGTVAAEAGVGVIAAAEVSSGGVYLLSYGSAALATSPAWVQKGASVAGQALNAAGTAFTAYECSQGDQNACGAGMVGAQAYMEQKGIAAMTYMDDSRIITINNGEGFLLSPPLLPRGGVPVRGGMSSANAHNTVEFYTYPATRLRFNPNSSDARWFKEALTSRLGYWGRQDLDAAIAASTQIAHEIPYNHDYMRGVYSPRLIEAAKTFFDKLKGQPPDMFKVMRIAGGEGVCLHKAVINAFLISSRGKDVWVVTGRKAASVERHAINAVEIKGSWYALDPTSGEIMLLNDYYQKYKFRPDNQEPWYGSVNRR